MSSRRRLGAFALWFVLVAILALLVGRAQFTADMSVFLPRSPTHEQQMLVDQLRDGMVSRLTLIGIEGGRPDDRAEVSKLLAASLRADAAFASVSNGEAVHVEADRRWLFDHRYALSPAITPDHFSSDGLRTALQRTLDLLASPAGLLAKPLVTRDPTGELLALLGQLDSQAQAERDGEVWVSQDGHTALLLAMTRASGGDIDAQEAAMNTIRTAFDAARSTRPSAAEMTLAMTGPGVFSVQSRATIKSEVTRIALLGTSLIIFMLLLIYRSLPVLLLGLLPVLTGALAGIAAVSLGFGVVHGLTLGFGTTLIGEAVDYGIYLFVQRGRGDRVAGSAMARFWPTIRLGLLTSVCGFVALLASGFPGLAQLGLYSLAGLLTAALVTRYLLPAMLPDDFRLRDVAPLGRRLSHLVTAASRLRWLVITLALTSLALIGIQRHSLWNSELLALSPVPQADQAMDMRLRGELGAPDVRYLIVVDGSTTEEALQAAEALAPVLERLQADGHLAGWDSPARYLPSNASQRARLAALPDTDELRARLNTATAGLPLRAERLEAFVADIAQARQQPLLDRDSMTGTSLALAVDAMLFHTRTGVRALLPLRAPESGRQAHQIDAATVRNAISSVPDSKALFLDLKHESDALYGGYLSEAIELSLGGIAAILLALLIFLRRPMRVLRIVLPLAAAILVVIAALSLAGKQLILLHLVGLLLIVAVGSNYALFFDREAHAGGPPDPHTLASLLFANLTTVAGFGLLAFSDVPVLQAIGITVGPGAVLALVFSAMLSRRDGAPPGSPHAS